MKDAREIAEKLINVVATTSYPSHWLNEFTKIVAVYGKQERDRALEEAALIVDKRKAAAFFIESPGNPVLQYLNEATNGIRALKEKP